tara:strand:- start:72 stop:278 length:207 start_codon:yes stop_codon:yes gene_type:complete
MFFNIFKNFYNKTIEFIELSPIKNKYFLFYNDLDYIIKGKYYIYNNIKYTSKSTKLIDKTNFVGIMYL